MDKEWYTKNTSNKAHCLPIDSSCYSEGCCVELVVLHFESIMYMLVHVFCGVVCQTDLVIKILIFFSLFLICPSIAEGIFFSKRRIYLWFQEFYNLFRLFSVTVCYLI